MWRLIVISIILPLGFALLLLMQFGNDRGTSDKEEDEGWWSLYNKGGKG